MRRSYRLLGGSDNRVRAYASTALRRDEAASRETAQVLADRGFGAIKLRFSTDDWRRDIARAAAVRDAVGPGIDLMVDCNQAWRMSWDTAPPWELETARTVAHALAELDAYWMEEPLHRGDYAGMAALRAETGVRIAGGEVTREDPRVPHPDRARLPRRAAAGLCLRRRHHGMRANRCGCARGRPDVHAAHVGARAGAPGQRSPDGRRTGGAPYLEFPFDPPDWVPARRDFGLKETVEADDEGWLTLPDRPGLGAALDEDVLRDTLVDGAG